MQLNWPKQRIACSTCSGKKWWIFQSTLAHPCSQWLSHHKGIELLIACPLKVHLWMEMPHWESSWYKKRSSLQCTFRHLYHQRVTYCHPLWRADCCRQILLLHRCHRRTWRIRSFSTLRDQEASGWWFGARCLGYLSDPSDPLKSRGLLLRGGPPDSRAGPKPHGTPGCQTSKTRAAVEAGRGHLWGKTTVLCEGVPWLQNRSRV